MHVHHYHGSTRQRPALGRGFPRLLGGLLDAHVNCEHDIFPRFRGVQNSFRLTITLIVYEHGFCTSVAMQFFFTASFNSDDTAKVQQSVSKITFFTFHRTIIPHEIDSLPLNGRNYLDLAALTPAVTRANPVANQRFAETSAVPGTQINIAGQRNINNGFVIDGLSANDDAADLPGTFFSQEVIREFQIVSSGGIAEFGRASGGVNSVRRVR